MDNIKKITGKRIKELRKAKNLTQEQLAEIAGVDWRSLSHVECGDTFPSKYLPNIACALNITLPELFDFEHLKVDRKYMQEYIINNLSELSDENITVLYRLIKSMR